MDGSGGRGSYPCSDLSEGRLLSFCQQSCGCMHLHGAAPCGSNQLVGRSGANADENRADFSGANDVLIEVSLLRYASPPSGCSGETLDLCLSYTDGDGAFGVVLPPWGIIFKQVLAGGANRWCSVASTASTTAGVGGMAQWSR